MKHIQNLLNWKGIIFCLLFYTTHSALLAWSQATPISSLGNNSSPVSAIDTNGNGVVVWLNGTFPETQVHAATYISGVWSSVLNLTDVDAYFSPRVAVDSTGNAIVVWEYYTPGNNEIQTVRIPYNGAPESILTISNVGDNRRPNIVLDAAGNGFATWEDRSTDKIFAARYNTMTSWSAPTVVATTGGLFSPNISINSTGEAITYWFNTGLSRGRTAIYNLGSWNDIGTFDANSSPQVHGITLSIDSLGNAVAVWLEDTNAELLSSYRAANGSWNPLGVISDDYPNSFQSIVTDPLGNAVAAWVNYGLNIVEATNFTGGSWQTPVIISNGIGNQDVNVNVDSSGNALVVYQSWDGGTIQGVNLPFGGVWSSPFQISGVTGYSFSPFVKTNAVGNSIAVWVNSDGSDSAIHASVN